MTTLSASAVSNADFDLGLSLWQPGVFGIPTHQPGIDALGLPGSGSASIRIGELPPGLPGGRLEQCLPVTGGDEYLVGAALGGDAGAGVRVDFFADPSCALGFDTGPAVSLASALGEGFVFLLSPPVAAPVDTVAARLQLDRPSGSIGLVESRFDKILLRRVAEVVPLTAGIEAAPQGLAVRFEAQVAGGLSPLPPRLTWDFGDGVSAMGASGATGSPVLHEYSESGSYTVELRVDSGYEELTVSSTVTVSEALEVPVMGHLGAWLLLVLLAAAAVRRLQPAVVPRRTGGRRRRWPSSTTD